MSDAVIEFRGTSKAYATGLFGRRLPALQPLELSVPKGSIYGFLGANGAGKTTAIKILMGLQFADAGETRMLGGDTADPEVKSRVGYLPERPYFHEALTAYEFLDFHRSLFGGYLEGRKLPKNQELLELVGLGAVENKSLKGFSKGMLQRIGIAQAILNDPDLVILDEPMSGLDPVGRKDVRDLILRLSESGKTVFFSSHILSDIESICTRVAFLEKGHLRFEGSLEDVRASGGRGCELLFRCPPGSALGGTLLAGARPSGAAFLLRLASQDEARLAIEQLWRVGGTLESLHGAQRSLEDFLFGKENI